MADQNYGRSGRQSQQWQRGESYGSGQGGGYGQGRYGNPQEPYGEQGSYGSQQGDYETQRGYGSQHAYRGEFSPQGSYGSQGGYENQGGSQGNWGAGVPGGMPQGGGFRESYRGGYRAPQGGMDYGYSGGGGTYENFGTQGYGYRGAGQGRGGGYDTSDFSGYGGNISGASYGQNTSGYGGYGGGYDTGTMQRGGDNSSPEWQQGSQRPRHNYVGRGPKGYRRSDERIQEDVSEQLMMHPAIDASEMELRVNNGEVTLTGTVQDRQSKRLAEDIVESCLGVTEVHNQLRVSRSGEGQSQSMYDREVTRRPESEQTQSASGSPSTRSTRSTSGATSGTTSKSGTESGSESRS